MVVSELGGPVSEDIFMPSFRSMHQTLYIYIYVVIYIYIYIYTYTHIYIYIYIW